MVRALALPFLLAAVALMWTPPPVSTAEPLPPPRRPTRFDYNCDGTGVLQDMTWTAWGVDGAKGTGTDGSIECKPNCRPR
ncbi:hypothetical protein CIW52_30700 [Mycolicibacterium sp. P9-64]|uniref:hypothetical protein n=1 Tax=Mycolicibacterium sp. P9-64 TaxID=2024612 RepID=UPI0011EEFBD1|nr:hypothetical protein [Mycolicibacterium sp. P9-64]KAA0078917.1 hypothetical protein CIW52_30700 [Mycolicibacterium sp. P9-64]